MKGADWPLGDAPQAVMAPDNGADDGWDVAAFVEHHIAELGFTAVCRPLQGIKPSGADRRLCELADELGFMVLPWMYGDVQGGTAPEDALGSRTNRLHQERVVGFYAPFRNVAIDCGYDNREWASDNEGNRWYRRCKEWAPHLLFGIRARLDEPRRDPDDLDAERLGYRPGDYASFEVRLTDEATIADMIFAADSPVFPGEAAVRRPAINAERFRIGSRAKDLRDALHAARVLTGHRVANLGGIYGIRDAGPNWRWPAGAHAAIQRANGLDVGPGPGPAPAPRERPTAADVEILHPGTDIRSWPVVDGPVVSALVRDDGLVELAYPVKDWPGFNTITQDHQHIGTAWIVWFERGLERFAAYPAEHLQANDRERKETSFNISKLEREGLAQPEAGDLVGFIVAGPSRHAADSPEYRRRTAPRWFTWGAGELAPAGVGFATEDPDDETPEQPPDEPGDSGGNPTDPDDSGENPTNPDDSGENPPAPAPGPDIEEIIMGILEAPIVDEALKLVREFLDERQSQRALLITLIDKAGSPELVDRLIEQHLEREEIDLENRRWWQERFRALGDIFDGDAWERLVDLFDQVGIDLPAETPTPVTSAD